MNERIKQALKGIGTFCVSHRTQYFCLFGFYAATLVGVDKHVIELVPAVCYFVLALHVGEK